MASTQLRGGCDVYSRLSDRDVLNSLSDNIFINIIEPTLILFFSCASFVETADDGKTVPSFPFPTEADDHCETPVNSYRDIVPLLQKISSRINGTTSSSNSSLRIYDPYYCNGAMVEHMAQVGFPNVYNRKEDCYSIWSSSKCPVFDVLVTNPPYSGDHIAQLMQHVTAKQFGDRPWLLLLPQWVHKKNYYVLATKHIRPFYLVPTKRYVYIPPKHFRDAKKSDVHKKSSPFCSMWYVWGGSAEFNETLIQHYHRTYKKGSESARAPCALARSKSALRDLRRKKS